MASYDVIVAGVGSAGSAVCLELARRGARVLGLDAFTPPHALGGHHGRSRSIRRAYLEGSAYVPMVLAAWEAWRKLERDSGRTLLRVTGNLTIGRPEDTALSGFLRSARRYGIPHEELTAREVRRRWPALRPPEGFAAGLELEAGVLFPEGCVAALLDQAARAGAELRFDEPVTAWSAAPGGSVRVVTTSAQYEAERLVLTTGARAGKLLCADAPPVAAQRVAVHWLRPPPGGAFELGALPVNFWQLEDGLELYALPVTEPGGRVKFAAHAGLSDCDPDTVERTVGPKEEARARRLLAATIPDLAGRDMVSDTCLYAMTPDRDFVLGPVPGRPMALVGAFAGHGFKFAPVLGRVLADMALGLTPGFEVGAFDPGRFRGW